MKRFTCFKKKKVTIVGLARSGLACANLLCDLGVDVSITDYQDNNLTRKNASELRSKKIKIELGRHTKDFIKERDFIVVSPGVTDSSPALLLAKKFKIPLISEIELAWLMCPATVIAVTGTNGKTTVTTLIGKILEADRRKVFVCGNIGRPFSAELGKMRPGDFVSLEVSSFQLERIHNFKPKIAVILNFSHNHLDRYKNIKKYLKAKMRIFMNQDENDYLVLNRRDPVVKSLASQAKTNIVYFSETEEFNSNQAAVAAVGSLLGIDKQICVNVFKNFKGIEHRLEDVAQINNIRFINDSKSTTVESAAWALKNISQPILLIAGGKDKGVNYSMIGSLARQKVRQLILIGEARKKIKAALGNFIPTKEANSLKEAVNLAFCMAKPGDCILLSPMCSSFDMFSDFEERGITFKKIVSEISKKKSA